MTQRQHTLLFHTCVVRYHNFDSILFILLFHLLSSSLPHFSSSSKQQFTISSTLNCNKNARFLNARMKASGWKRKLPLSLQPLLLDYWLLCVRILARKIHTRSNEIVLELRSLSLALNWKISSFKELTHRLSKQTFMKTFCCLSL